MVNWRELHVTEEEQKKIQEVIDSGAGKTLPKEKLEEFKTGHEESFMISTEAGDIRVYYYRPAGSEGKVLPAYLNLHGGGFVKGRRDQDTVLDRNYCEKTGWAVIDIDYIPAPTVRYPGQVYQTYGVLQYCTDQANAEKLGIDPECIVLGGHSAGGNLTAAATLMAIDRNGRLPKGIILDYAVLDNSTSASEKRNGDSNPSLPLWKQELYSKMYADPDQRNEVYCSPALASDEQLRRMPMTLMLYCENDVFCDEAAAFQSRLLAQGIQVYGKRFFHSSHGFTVRRNGEYEVAEKLIFEFLNMMRYFE